MSASLLKAFWSLSCTLGLPRTLEPTTHSHLEIAANRAPCINYTETWPEFFIFFNRATYSRRVHVL